jgi:hypothetical protein
LAFNLTRKGGLLHAKNMQLILLSFSAPGKLNPSGVPRGDFKYGLFENFLIFRKNN